MTNFLSLTVTSLLVVSTILGMVSGTKVRYDGYKVVRLTPRSQNQLKSLQQLEELGATFWDEPSRIGRPADVMLSPELQNMVPALQRRGMKVDSFVEDVQGLIDQTEKQMAQKSPRFSWDSYYNLTEIYTFMHESAAMHPDCASVISIGQSYEGRDLKVLKISKSPTANNKSVIWIDSAIHAREWISPAVCTYLMHQILTSGDPEIESWSSDFDWYFMPIVNPDGYEYTHTKDRMWRKTRSLNHGSSCVGTDPNRNFDMAWATTGTSPNECSEIFHGSHAFSEVESLAVANFLDSIGDRLVFYCSLHSYSQLILIPFSHKNTHLPDYDYCMNVTKKAADLHATRHGTKYTYGNTVDILYGCAGTSMDYVKGVTNPNCLTLSYELPDTGDYGFILPPEKIRPTCQEFMDGFRIYPRELREGGKRFMGSD